MLLPNHELLRHGRIMACFGPLSIALTLWAHSYTLSGMAKHTIPTTDEQMAAFRARTSNAALFPRVKVNDDHRAENIDRLQRAEHGDVTDHCYWCGAEYVNIGCFPYCSLSCAARAEND